MKAELIDWIRLVDTKPAQVIVGLREVRALLAKLDWKIRGSKDSTLKENYLTLWTTEDFAAAKKYLQEFSQGHILDVIVASKIWELYEMKFALNRDQNISALFLPALGSAIDLGAVGKDLVRSLVSHYISNDGLMLKRAMHILREKYYQGHSDELKLILREIWYSDTESPHIVKFMTMARAVTALGEGYHDVVEIFLLSIFDRTLYGARFSETALSLGGGFHYAQDVNHFVEGAAIAIEEFDSLGITRSLTARLDLNRLRQVFLAMVYDSLGRRGFGDGVTAQEAFGLSGAIRKEKLDPYCLINDYLAGKIATLQIEHKPRR